MLLASLCKGKLKFKIFFKRITRPISIKRGTNHPSMKKNQLEVSSNEIPCPLLRVNCRGVAVGSSVHLACEKFGVWILAATDLSRKYR